MARSMTNAVPTLASPVFCGDFMGREQLLPGGVKVDPTVVAADAYGRRPIPAGTVIGRTLAERDASAAFGLAVNTDDEIFIVAFDVTDAADINDCEVLRAYAGVLIKENFLPGFSGLAALLQTAIRARYNCVRGAE